MHRLLATTEELSKDGPAISAEAARHLKVLRPKDAERVELFDGKGAKRVFRYDAAGRRLVAEAGEGTVTLPRPRPLTLFACVTKGSRWDWTIEKATELGVTRIVPVVSARTIVRVAPEEREAKRARWMRIAEDAARQSDAVWLPEILPPVDFASSLELVRRTDCFVGALVTPVPDPLAAAVANAALDAPDGAAVYVGPEGDFTSGELAALLKIATPTTFGPTVLRAETAAIFAVSVLSSALRTPLISGGHF